MEGIKNYSAKGNILVLDENLKFKKTLINDGKHYSYPFLFTETNKEYIMPEVASHSKPYILNSNNLNEKKILKFDKNLRLLDSTLFKRNNIFYIFGTSYKKDLLYLFYSNNLTGKFYEHKSSPINIEPYGCRMAGNIFVNNKKIYRFGQNNLLKYGASLLAFEITLLNINEYEEKFIKEFKVNNFFGPHSFSTNKKNELYFDFYYEKFSLYSGVRRLLEKL